MYQKLFVWIFFLFLFTSVVFGQNVKLTTTCLGPGTISATAENGTVQIINCDSVTCFDSRCERIVPSGSEITVNATAVPGGHFSSWSQSTGSASACNGLNGPCVFTITQDSKAAAFFDNPRLNVQVNVIGGGKATVKFSSGATFINSCPPGSCTRQVDLGTKLTFIPEPDPGFSFQGWTSGTGSTSLCTGISACSAIISSESSITAKFAPSTTPQSYIVTVKTNGPGSVTGTKPLSTINVINCGSLCQASLASGSLLTLVATPARGALFIGWTDGNGSANVCTGKKDPQCVFGVTSPGAVTANFRNMTP